VFWGGAYREALPLQEHFADTCLERGELALAAGAVAFCSRLRSALGDLEFAERDLVRAAELAQRAGNPPYVIMMRGSAVFDVVWCRGVGLELGAPMMDAAIARDDPGMRHLRAGTYSVAALLFAFAGRDQDARGALARAMPAVKRAGGGVNSYTGLICHCCEVLWRLGRADFADVLERNLLAKTLAGDFRFPGVDARLAMAQLCALNGRPGEAHDWFERARAVLDEQGARPLRALVDLDEAWMEIRRGLHGDRDRARALLDAACEQFQAIGMPGWIERAEALRAQGEEMGFGDRGSGFGEEKSISGGVEAVAQSAASSAAPRPPTPDTPFAAAATFRCEGDYWTLIYDGVTARLKDMKGLHHIAELLRHPGRELHVVDLMRGLPTAARGSDSGSPPETRNPGLAVLDSSAKAAYRQRLADLREELAEAEQFNDAGRATRAREEMELLTEHLAGAVGLGGRDRLAASDAERARSGVTQNIRAAIRRIRPRLPALADQLQRHIKTGTYCAYAPDPAHPIDWAV